MLELRIKQFKYDKEIFKDTSFNAYPGQLTILTGESGAGKSTLLSILACLHQGSFEGSYKLEDQEVIHSSYRQVNLFYVLQNPSFIFDLTIYDNFVFFLEAHGCQVDQEEIISLATKLNMEDKLKLYPKQLSGGEKQKAAIIMALCSKMKVILLDEPTASLDSESVIDVLKLIKETDSYLIVSSHSPEVMDLADRHYHIKDKRLHLVKAQLPKEKVVEEKKFIKPSIFKLSTLLMKQWKYRKVLKILLLILTTISILGVTVSFNLGNKWMVESYQRLHNMFNPVLLIQKDNLPYFNLSARAWSSEDQAFIQGLSGYKHLETYHRYSNQTFYFLKDGEIDDAFFYQNEEDGYGLIKCFDENGNQLGEPIGMSELIDGVLETDVYHLSTYYEEIDYTSKLKQIYDNEGVIIDSDIASRLGVQEDCYLEISLAVPTHHLISKDNIVTNSMGITYPSYDLLFTFVDVILPVKGIVDEQYYGINGDLYGMPTIYVPHGFYEDLIKHYQSTQSMDHDFYYVIPYTPKYYYLETDTVEQLNLFKEKIEEESNLAWYSGTINVDELLDALKIIMQQLIYISITVYLGIFVIFFIVQYLNKENQLEKLNVFKLLGISTRQQLLLLTLERLPDFLLSIGLSLGVFPFVLNYVKSISRHYHTELTSQMIVMVIVLAFMVMVLFHVLTNYSFKVIERKEGVNHD